MSESSREQRRVVSDPAEFGHVAVMLGGESAEREVSLDTGNAVLDALRQAGVSAQAWDLHEKGIVDFATAGFDRVWIALHGSGGEDGALQGCLEWLGMPYTGSGVKSSAIAMDKVRSKKLFMAAGIPTPEFVAVESCEDAVAAAEPLGYPLFVKPSCQGSSVGMTKVRKSLELNDAIEFALRYDDTALIEPCVIGDEMTVGVLHGEALPSIRIATPRDFYDYRAKYQSERTEYDCPGTDDAKQERRYAELAMAAFTELGCSGWGRVDFMTGTDGVPQVLEVNTIPGMTSHSLVPKAAAAVGIDFGELCWRILETSFDDVANVVEHGVARHGT